MGLTQTVNGMTDWLVGYQIFSSGLVLRYYARGSEDLLIFHTFFFWKPCPDLAFSFPTNQENLRKVTESMQKPSTIENPRVIAQSEIFFQTFGRPRCMGGRLVQGLLQKLTVVANLKIL